MVTGATAFAGLTAVLVTAAVWDIRTQRVPNALTYGGILVGLGYWTMVSFVAEPRAAPMPDPGFTTALLGMLAGGVPLLLIFAMGGLGGGDVKLAAAMGAIGGSWRFTLAALGAAAVVAMIMAVFVMLRRRLVRQTMGRLFSVAITLAARSKPQLPDDSPRIPVAAAMAVGGVLAGVEYLLGVALPWSV